MRDEPTRPEPANPTGNDRAAEEADTLASGHGAGGPVTGDPHAGKDAGDTATSDAHRERRGGDPNLAAGGDDI